MPYAVKLVIKFPIDLNWKQQALIFDHFVEKHLDALGI